MRPHLASLVEDWRQNAKDTAVVTHRGNRALRTSYTALAELTGRFAAELDRRGVGPGERVVLWGENSAAWIAAFFGCVLRGVIAVPLDATGSAAFADRVIAEVTPRLIVGDAKLLAALGGKPRLVLAELAESLPWAPTFAVQPAMGLDTPLQIVFTSGTTSEPKGVVHTHRNVLASVEPIEREIVKYRRYARWVHPLRFLHTLPLSHVFGQFMGMWLPPLLSAEVHFIDSVEPARLVSTIKRERVSVVVAVPRILELLRSLLRQRFPWVEGELARSRGISAAKRWWRFRPVHRELGLKCWALICGGATLPEDLESFWNGLGFALVQGYGMTETAALVTLNHPFHVGKGTLGKALPGREVRLSPEGEIEVRGEMLAAGTWSNGALQPRAGEWLSTGDLGVQGASGELRFTGRKGDTIVTAAGLNIHPRDLEKVLLAQPGVRGCAVVGCDTLRGSEAVAVVLFQGGEDQLRAVREAANAQLAAFQQMHYVLCWPEPALPYTTTGKLLRRRIAAWACAQIQPGKHGAEAMGATDALASLIAGITQEPVNGDDEQRLTEDLHLDSLGRVQLQSAIEQQMGVEVDEEEMARAGTLGEVRTLLRRQGEIGSPRGDGRERPSGFRDRTSREAAGGRGVRVVAASAQLSLADGGGHVAAEGKGTKQARAPSYPRWPWTGPVQWLRAAFTELVMRPLVRVLGAPRVVNAAYVPVQGPLLIIANHVNTYDVPLILYALPGPLRRHVATAMSAEVLGDLRHGRNQGHALLNLLARPAAWLIVALFNVFPLPRLSGFRRSFAHAGEAMDRGYSVLVFPEGRRSQTGELAPFRPGIGLLVRESGVPVLPVAVQGMGATGREGRWFRPRRLAVRLGDPLRFGADDAPEQITTQLEAALRALGPS